jgi:hypothetical protein
MPPRALVGMWYPKFGALYALRTGAAGMFRAVGAHGCIGAAGAKREVGLF